MLNLIETHVCHKSICKHGLFINSIEKEIKFIKESDVDPNHSESPLPQRPASAMMIGHGVVSILRRLFLPFKQRVYLLDLLAIINKFNAIWSKAFTVAPS